MRLRAWAWLIPIIGWESVVFVACMSRSGYVWDDLVNFRAAQTRGLSFGYLTSPLFEQFAPAHKLFDWFVQRFFPMNFHAAIVISVLWFVAGLIAFYALARSLCAGAAVLTALYGASLVQLGTAQWWAAGIHRLPASALSLTAMVLFVRYVRTGERPALVGSVVAFAVGVLFSFSALFVPLYLVLLVLLVLDRRPPLRTWIPYGIVVVAAVVAYVAWVHADLRLSGPVDVARYVVHAWAVVFVPAFVGFSTPLGRLPLRWVVAAVAFQAALAALVVATRAHWRAWAFLVVAVLANLVFVGLTRVNGASPELIAHGFRYLADVNFLFPLALGLACREVTVRWPALPAAALGVVLGLTFVGNGVVSGPTAWFGPSAARYAARLRAGVEEVRRSGGAVLDGQVPEYVVPAAFGPYNRLSEVVPLFDRHVTVGRQAGAVWQVEATGQVEPVTLVSRTGGRAVDLQRAKRLFVVRSAATSSVRGDLCVQSGADAAVLAWALQPALPSADWHLTVESTTPISTGGAVFVYRGGAWTAAHDPYLALGAGTQVSTVDLGGPQLEDLLIELPARKTVCIGALNIDQLIPRSVPSHAHA